MMARQAWALCLSGALLGVAFAVPLTLSAVGAAEQAGGDWPCEVTSRRVARPPALPLDAKTKITFTLATSCPPVTRPLRIVLLIDASRDMRNHLSVLQSNLVSAVANLGMAERPWLAMGVVSFAEQAEVKRTLTSSPEHVIAAVRDVTVAGGTATAAGLQDGMRKALRMLPAARPGRPQADIRDGPREVIVVMSAGVESGTCDRVRDQSADARASGVLVVTACVGANCDRTCLAELPSRISERQFSFRSWSSWGFLVDLMKDLVASTGPFFSPIARVVVVDLLHENLLYEGGGDPSTGDGRRLSWSFAPWSAEVITRAFQAQAVGVGRFLVSRSISATVYYNGTFWPGLARTVALSNPVLEVFDPSLRTPSVPPTPTEAPRIVPTDTPRPSPSPTPEVSKPSEPRPSRLHLPYLAQASCPRGLPVTDLVLLLDVSGSMQGPATGYPGDRRTAAGVVAAGLLDGLGARDQAAVLQFGAQTEVLAPLAPCCTAARSGLAGLGYLDGTRLERALAAAEAQLTGAKGRAWARRVLVLLTDGDLNQSDEAAVDLALTDLADLGVLVFVVGVSDEADEALLIRLAGRRERVVWTGRDGLLPALWPAGPPPRCW